MPWLLNEAAALKKKIEGLTVHDANAPSGRPVEVRFREPEVELADMTYPAVILEYAGIEKADDREHRGPTTLPYIPEGDDRTSVPTVDPVTGVPHTWDITRDYDVTLSPFKVMDHPVPYNIDFTVTVYARLQNHLMSLVGTLGTWEYLPARFGFLDIPQDGTTRVLDLLAGPEIIAQRDSEGKRTFRAVYSIRVTSELNILQVQEIAHRISDVNFQIIQIQESRN